MVSESRDGQSSGDENDPGSDDDFERGFVVASNVDMRKQEKVRSASTLLRLTSESSVQARKKKRSDLVALEEWRHIHCLRRSAHEDIRDTLLQRLLQQRVPSSHSDRLDESTQSKIWNDEDEDADESESTKDVMQDPSELAGGDVTFVFERKTKAETPLAEPLD